MNFGEGVPICYLPLSLIIPRLVLVLCTVLFFPVAGRAQNLIVFDDARENGWQNWSWAPVAFNATAAHSGSNSIRVSPTSDHQALYLHHSAFDSSDYQSLCFWIHGGDSGGQLLQVQATLAGKAQTSVKLDALAAKEWRRIVIPLGDLKAAGQPRLDGLQIQIRPGGTLNPFLVDDVELIAAPPPERVKVKVDPHKVLGVFDERLTGMNTAIWDSQLGSKATAESLGAMGTKLLRFPGGSASDDYDWHTNRSVSKNHGWASSAATFAKVAEARAAQGVITVNYGSGTPEQAAAWVAYYNGDPASTQPLGRDAKGRDWKTAGFWASLRASAPILADDGYNFLRMSHPGAFAFRDWEVGNENYGKWEEDQHGAEGSGLSGAPHDPETYARWFKEFYTQMLAVDPAIRIGAVVATENDAPISNAKPRGWMHSLFAQLKAAKVTPHFLVYHYYPQNTGGECDPILLQATSEIAGKAKVLRAAINDSFEPTDGAKIELTMTELNSVSSDPGKQTTSIVNGLFLADAIGMLARTEFKTCVWWDLANGRVTKSNNGPLLNGTRDFGDYGVLAVTRSEGLIRYPTFYAAKLLTKWARGGDEVLSTDSSYRMLSAHAARLGDGRLSLLILNKHPVQDLTADVELRGFTPKTDSAEVYQYTQRNESDRTDISTSTFEHAASRFSYVFPPYSITVLVLK